VPCAAVLATSVAGTLGPMWTKPPREVPCTSSSVESFYRGLVAGGIFGIVFAPEGAGVRASAASSFKPAVLAGSWCFFTSFASCVLTRSGVGFPWNGAISGLFSGSALGLLGRWPRQSVAWTMVFSSILSVTSHYLTEGHSQDGVVIDSTGRCAKAATAAEPQSTAHDRYEGPSRLHSAVLYHSPFLFPLLVPKNGSEVQYHDKAQE